MRHGWIPVVTGMLAAAMALGCGRGSKVIAEGKLVAILADMEIAEAYVRQPSGSMQFSRDSIGLAVLRHYDVTPEQLDSTLGWYGRNMDDYAKLYAKVDQRLNDRLHEITRASETRNAEGQRDIWPHSRHLRMADNQIGDTYTFSLLQPEIAPGERVEWKIRSKGSSIEMLLGVEYSDGESKYITSTLSSDTKAGVTLQTDTARTVSRLFGSLRRIGSEGYAGVLVDSISLVMMPIDSNEYYRERHLKRFIMRNPVAVKPVPEKVDSVSIAGGDSIPVVVGGPVASSQPVEDNLRNERTAGPSAAMMKSSETRQGERSKPLRPEEVLPIPRKQ